MSAKSFTDLKVWQVTYTVTNAVYDESEGFPATELYRLTDQMRRAVLSIGLNIAEGFGRSMPRDKVRFYSIAFGSTEELKHCLLVANSRKFLKNFDRLWPDVESISKMLRALMASILAGNA